MCNECCEAAVTQPTSGKAITPHPAARGDVRGLVLSADEREWLECAIAHMRDDREPQDLTCADALEALLQRALADEGVQAGELDVEAIRRACQSGKRFWQAGPGYYEEIESLLPALTGEHNG